MTRKEKRTIKSYIIGILIPVVAGGLSALLTAGNMNIYDTITKPPFSPPGVLFPIALTILYILMGVSSVMVYNNTIEKEKTRNNALLIYGIQLVVNFFWSILFFNIKAFLISFIWLVVLWCLILIMIIKFCKINKISGFLQILYFIWVTFAGYLNFMIYLLN